jgi:hypothetical protein
MPTAATARLARAHDASQQALARQLASILQARWRLQVKAPGVGTDQFLEAATRAVRTQFAASAALSRGFYTTARRLEVPGSPSFSPVRPDFPDEAVVTSIVAAGFQELSQALERGNTLEDALERAGTSVTGAGIRHGLNGGRRTIIDSAEQDRLDVGYLRTPKPGCCSFCAVLASRGKVFTRESFDQSDPRFIGPGEVKVHDNCRCEFTPVFRRSDPDPQINQEFEKLWYDVKRGNPGLSGNEALNAFRRRYERDYLRSVGSDRAASTEAA